MASVTTEKLKVGIVINKDGTANWQFKVIEEIISSDFASIDFIVKNNKPSKFSFNNFVFKLHLKLDELILGRGTDYAKIFDVSSLSGIDQSTLLSAQNNSVGRPVDIILDFDSDNLNKQISIGSKFGILSYNSYAEPLGYTEVINKIGTTESVLQISNNEGRKVIHYSEMLTHFVSISKNRNACYWRAGTTILRILEGLYNEGDVYLDKLIKNNETHKVSEENKTAAHFSATKNIFKHFRKVGKRVVEKIFYKDHWDLMYKQNSRNSSLPSLDEFKLLPAPSDRDWADPFVVGENNKTYIFIEEMPYKTNRAHLAVLELDEKGKFINSTKILEKPYHLSFPFVFKYQETYYMIPETGGNKTVELYKSMKFPYEWEFEMNLMDNVYAGDVTLFYHNTKWWMFCCMDKSGRNIGMLDELYLFFSDDLFATNWVSHPQNPICTSSRIARPAGKIFIKDNKIYRPSQDCSGIYGRGLNINEIIKLSETEYEEKLVKKILPASSDYIKGVHTFNFTDEIMLIDGFRYNKRSRINKLRPDNIDLSNFYKSSQKASNSEPVLD